MTGEPRKLQYVYGPVPSRRLGRSLGVDLVPFKTCTCDCVYCQLGRTTAKTTERREYVPVGDVLSELREKLASGGPCDYIGLAGSGEPTLHSGIGTILREVKRMTKVPVAVLTNGTLLWKDEVQEELMEADLVMPSLDAGDERLFRWVNRPHEDISFDRMVAGLVSFTRRFRGEVWLEVLLIDGVTGFPSHVERIAALVGEIAPARVQLNTVSRPPAELFAHPVPEARLHALASLFPGRVEVLAASQGTGPAKGPAPGTSEVEILTLLRRRPCTAGDVAEGLGIHLNEVLKHLDRLRVNGLVNAVAAGGRSYYTVTGSGSRADVGEGTAEG